MIFSFCMVRYRDYEQKVLKIQNFDENKDFISNVWFNVYILLIFFKVTQKVLCKTLWI